MRIEILFYQSYILYLNYENVLNYGGKCSLIMQENDSKIFKNETAFALISDIQAVMMFARKSTLLGEPQ